MFDFGFHNYLQHGFPKANLLDSHSPSWALWFSIMLQIWHYSTWPHAEH